MKIAVLGGTGMAGHVVITYLKECGHDVYFTSRRAPDAEKSKPIDATDVPGLCSWLDSVKPDVIVNCMGILQKEADARADIAILINGYIPRHLEHRFSNTNVKIIHLSTDCVFSGKKGGYLVTDVPDGETPYDRTKALGEISNEKDLTFRMSIIGPDCNENGTGLFNWFMKQQGEIKGFTKAFWNGVTTIELSKAIDAAINQNLSGIYHLVPKEGIDKYSLLLLFRDVFGKSDLIIETYDGFVVDKTLVNTRTDFNFSASPYAQQISEMKEWINSHKEFYPHYN
ncbi:MAG: SDR family oxidoreductase [Defluviitaleaceae bacterium]|nr:SDR family oxidoreductase [Defluviitaleaceae bacterium]